MNYPDDIRNFDYDSRSPFYDSTKDDAVEDFTNDLFTLIHKDLIKNRGENIDLIIKNEIDVDFCFEEIIESNRLELGLDNICLESIIFIDLIVNHVIELLKNEILNYLEGEWHEIT